MRLWNTIISNGPDGRYDLRMVMKTVDILGENRFENYTKTRDGSRAIIIKDGKILLTHELNSDKPGSRCRSG